MKRYVCTVAAGVLLALAGADTAAATGSTPPDQTQVGTQSVSFGDQSVGEQKNDADVTQEQGNGNLNVAPGDRHPRRCRQQERAGQRQLG
jgi:hypothetical protein